VLSFAVISPFQPVLSAAEAPRIPCPSVLLQSPPLPSDFRLSIFEFRSPLPKVAHSARLTPLFATLTEKHLGYAPTAAKGLALHPINIARRHNRTQPVHISRPATPIPSNACARFPSPRGTLMHAAPPNSSPPFPQLSASAVRRADSLPGLDRPLRLLQSTAGPERRKMTP
jgi:hypothetical protein